MSKNNYLTRVQGQFNAELKRQRQETAQNLGQIHILAMMTAAHTVLQVGPGRAGKFLREYINIKQKIAASLLEDVGDRTGRRRENTRLNGDPDFWATRKEWADILKGILGPEGWDMFHELFPLLEHYWPEKGGGENE